MAAPLTTRLGPETPDAIDHREPKPVTVREALTALRDRIDRFLGERARRDQ